MEQNGVANYRHRQSPSSDRFLGVFSPTKQAPALGESGDDFIAGDELNEDDVFWNGDFNEPHGRSSSPAAVTNVRHPFRQPDKFGILAALSSDNRNPNQPLLQRKSSLSPSTTSFIHKTPPSASPTPTQPSPFSRPIPSIPKPHNFNSYSQSMPGRKFQQSAPMNVPIMPRKPRNGSLADVDIDDDDAEDEMLPPHEIVARGSAARSPKTTFSVLEGAGRTLKGRDLRQVRNAIWRQTGFLD
ncbi:OLC1v1034155C1 [Oldenlandia corymbosa var. corymbosa]|uniref:OLC1v1034155C1 n=1 Tax=Oldenlandia corymbosa var. corymbosa TaxID=529605 RepID=A0AAV1CQR4_OLDCO|nr:OLC1v1034155C1 [Oldenlandia corymbosa var. corymbosa]